MLKSSIGTIWRALLVAKNPLSILTLKTSKSPKPVTLRHTNRTYRITYAQFRVFRDAYPLLKEYSIEQVGDDVFRFSRGQSEVCCTSEYAPMLFELMQDFTLKQENGLFHLESDKIKLRGSLQMLMCLHELRNGEYENDYQNKVVLDVGGFEGESAAYFWSKGAKKIVIYEPIAEHIDLIKKNIQCNNINAEIHQAGIADKDGKQTLYYDVLDPGVGALSKGPKQVEINVFGVSGVLEKSGANIAKFDCEGAEQYLVNVPTEILRKIGYYMIEVHSSAIRCAVLAKFLDSGFALDREVPKSQGFSVLSFKKT